MANTFKNNTKSSLVTAVITDPTATVVTAGSTATLIVLSVLVSNKTGTSANVDVYLDRNTGDACHTRTVQRTVGQGWDRDSPE